MHATRTAAVSAGHARHAGRLQLLFMGHGLLLHSAPSALLLLGVCLLYFKRRTALEAAVLHDRFKDEYDAWAARTPAYVPRLWPQS